MTRSNQEINQSARSSNEMTNFLTREQQHADEDGNLVVLHVLVMRVLYELWKLCSAISPANAILMYASRINVGASNETCRCVSLFLFEYTSLFVTRYEFGIHSLVFFLFRIPPSFFLFLFSPLFFSRKTYPRIRDFPAAAGFYNCFVNCQWKSNFAVEESASKIVFRFNWFTILKHFWSISCAHNAHILVPFS